MFERFTERPRKVVAPARVEAGRPRHDCIDVERLLPGPLREEEGVAARILYSAGATFRR